VDKCLITGSTGFIGSRLVKCLDDLNYDILVVSRNPQSNYKSIICDLQNDEIPESILNGIDVVFHLAGISHDSPNKKNYENIYNKVNFDATIRLAKASMLNNVKKFIFVSSVKAGGPSIKGQLMNENSDSMPEGVYGKSKRKAELELLKIAQKSSMIISIIRPALVYGPDVKGNLGKMISGINAGWFPPLPEIGNSRSMIHVDDLVHAILFIVNNKHTNREIFIATDGEFYSSRKIYEIISFSLNKSVSSWSVPKAFFDLAASISFNIRYKINKIMGDEKYSSKKLQLLGFSAQKKLKDINQSSFQ
jgi:UDP-glucose 4-epimerase